ncbi:hypothetical protein LCGC14_2049160, partial [marine sediment metagenome]
ADCMGHIFFDDSECVLKVEAI